MGVKRNVSKRVAEERARTARRNKRRGSSTEKRVAEIVNTYSRRLRAIRYPGVAGDVMVYAPDDPDTPVVMIEVKSRKGLNLLSNQDLRDIIKQVWGYTKQSWRPGQRWAIALTGGQGFRGPSKLGYYAILPFEEYLRLLDIEEVHAGTQDREG